MRELRLCEGAAVVDATAGGGGHAAVILERIGRAGRLIGMDRDPVALKICGEHLKDFGEGVTLVHENYRHLKDVIARAGFSTVDAILIDCGVSSMQLDEAGRGFSFVRPGPLDMRMDPTRGPRCEDYLRAAREKELEETIRLYGGERYARRIARAVKNLMARTPHPDTADLAAAVRNAVPGRGRIDAATRTFQALRIRVNDELAALEEALAGGIDCLKGAGRMAVITFHSLEDGLVKRAFRAAEDSGRGRRVVKKPLRPGPEEVRANPRARSAKLRIFEKGEEK